MKRTISKLFYYAIGTFGSKVIYFLLVPFYSFFLSKSELGFYDLILASLTIITPIITIQVSDAVYRELHDPVNETLKSAKAFSSGLSVIFIGMLIFAFAAFFINKFFANKNFYELILIQSSFTLYVFFSTKFARTCIEQRICSDGDHECFSSHFVFTRINLLFYNRIKQYSIGNCMRTIN